MNILKNGVANFLNGNDIQKKIEQKNKVVTLNIVDGFNKKPIEAIQYGKNLAEKVDSEYIDTLVIKVIALKKYLEEIKKDLDYTKYSLQELDTLMTNVYGILDTIVNKSKKDQEFFFLLAGPCLEVKNMIGQIEEKIEYSKLQAV